MAKARINRDREYRRNLNGAFGRANIDTYRKLAKGTSIETIVDKRYIEVNMTPPPPTNRPAWMG